jgi:hypothetical protein
MMLNAVLSRLRALMPGRSAAVVTAERDDRVGDADALAQDDPEWDELLAWAREPATPAPLLVGHEERDDGSEEEEWQWQVARAKAHAQSRATTPAAALPLARAPLADAAAPAGRSPAPPAPRAPVRANPLSSLAQRLERIAEAARAQQRRPHQR